MASRKVNPSAVRIAFERRADGSWKLQTADFDGVCEALSEEVVAAFASCYAHADRLNGLADMFMLDRRNRKSRAAKRTIAAQRNFNSFFALAAGLLKELSLELSFLHGALKRTNLLDVDEWAKGDPKKNTDGLARWVRWGNTKNASDLRNKFAFHADDDWIRDGIKKLRRKARRRTKRARQMVLYEGDSATLIQSTFRLSHDALFVGANSRKLYKELHGMFGIFPALDYCFGKTLLRAGLNPTPIHMSGALVSRFGL